MRGKVGVHSAFCVLCAVPSVLILIAFLDTVCELDVLSASDFEVGEPQTLSVSRKRGASVALEREQYRSEKAIMATAPVQSRSVSRGLCSKRCLSKEQGATCSRRYTAARNAGVAWTTVGATN